MRSISSKRMTCISIGRPVSSKLSGPSNTIWRRGDTINLSQGCLASGVLRNSGTTTLGSMSSTLGQTRLRCISSKRSKFLSHFILSSNSRRLASSLSRIFNMASFSSTSSVRDSISRSSSGTFMMCWTGATNRSVSCSFLHLGSLLHHWNEYATTVTLSDSIWCFFCFSLFLRLPFQIRKIPCASEEFPSNSRRLYNWVRIDDRLVIERELWNSVNRDFEQKKRRK